MSARVEFPYSPGDQVALGPRIARLVYGPAGSAFVRFAPLVAAIAIVPPAYLLAGWVDAGFQWRGFVVFVVILAGLAVLGIRRIRALLEARASRTSQLTGASCALEARPDCLVWTGPDWRSEIAWSGVERIDDGPKAVLLVFRGRAYFAPRQAFADDATRRAFVSACLERMTPEARRRSALPA
jgi:hypothetical protein